MATRKNLGLDLVARYNERKLPNNWSEVTDELLNRLREHAAQVSNRPKLELFGGSYSLFSTKGCDCDISYTWSGYNFLLSGMNHVQEQQQKKLFRFGKYLAEDCGMLAVRHVASRIPVVQFEDEQCLDTKIVCDVSIGNDIGVENSKILRQIHDIHPVIPLFVSTIKDWAKNKELCAPEKGTFNSFTVTCMCLGMLQDLQLLPVFSTATGTLGELTLEDVNNVIEKSAVHPAFQQCNPDDNDAMADALLFLLPKFSEYYTKFDWKNGSVSLTHPRRRRALFHEHAQFYLDQLKEAKRSAWQDFIAANKLEALDENELSEALHSEQIKRKILDTPFCVEEFPAWINCARGVRQARQGLIVAEFVKLNDMMKNPELSVEELLKPQANLKVVVSDYNTDGSRRVTRFNN